VRDGAGQVRRAVLTADEAMLQITRLVTLNGQGHDIMVRPAAGLASGLVVLDDLTAGALRRLRAEGHAPAAVTGTTDNRYQAWLRLSTDELDPQVAAEATRALQTRYGPGQGRDPRPIGPLAGFVDHTSARGARGEQGADPPSAETCVSATLVTVQGVGDEPGGTTPAAARALAEAEERVAAQREATAQEHEQGQERGGGIARWGAHLVAAVASEVSRDDETAGMADPWQRRRRRPGDGREDDERDGRGDR